MKRRLFAQLKRDLWLLLVIGLLVGMAVIIIIPRHSWGIFGPLLTHVETSEKVIALTFDDGPTEPQTSRLLSVLHTENVKATFYLIGVEMERQPRATDAIIAAGHEVGNHSYSHHSLMFQGYTGEANEIRRTDQLIREHGYVGPITIRPPFGHKFWELPLYATLNDRQIVMWDFVLGNEPSTSAAEIARHAQEKVRPGSIIIMHTMYDHNSVTLNAVQPLIKQLRADGYRFVTVSQLLRYR